jgi:hypothetical protein
MTHARLDIILTAYPVEFFDKSENSVRLDSLLSHNCRSEIYPIDWRSNSGPE